MKTVFCWGTFDILHQGHIDFIKDAKTRGEYLYVVVISDNAVYQNKRKFPKNNQEARVKTLQKTGLVDKVLAASDNLESNFEMIASLNPSIFVFGYDQQTPVEERLIRYLSQQGLKPEYYISKEFAGGIHTTHIRR